MATLGEFIRNQRVNVLDLSLRSFCIENNLDAGNWSKVERNMRQPPSVEELTGYLKLTPGSDEHQTLSDLHAVQKVTPHLTDEEVIKRLPIALRAARVLSDEQLEKLKEEIKEG